MNSDFQQPTPETTENMRALIYPNKTFGKRYLREADNKSPNDVLYRPIFSDRKTLCA